MPRNAIAAVYRTAEAIYRRLGPGYRELWYHRLLAIELASQGHTVHYEGRALRRPAASDPPSPCTPAGRLRGRPGRFDLLIDNWLLVELKTRYCLSPRDRDQVEEYLRGLNLTEAIILNFRPRPPHRLERRRIHL